METTSGIAVLEALVTGTNMPSSVQTNNGATVGTGNPPIAYDSADAQIGIGDGGGSVPSPSVSDYKLAATSNILYLNMSSGYPTVSNGTMTWQGTAGSSSGNFAWNEWGVFNGRQNSNIGVMLNHKGISMGTKASGTVWTFQATISQS